MVVVVVRVSYIVDFVYVTGISRRGHLREVLENRAMKVEIIPLSLWG